jgi:glycosyltransferase involved in cell wall biosynthesis
VSSFAIWKSFKYVSDQTQNRLRLSIHRRFAACVEKQLRTDTDVFIGLSAFSLGVLSRARELGIYTVVDHQSLHQRLEVALQKEDYERFGLRTRIKVTPQWLVEMEEREFDLADRVLVPSEVARRSLISTGVPAEKVLVNRLGVSLEQFRPGRCTDGIFRVIQCGTISVRKGVLYLLRAFQEAALPKSELWFVGAGLDETPLRPIIEKEAGFSVRFIGGVPQRDLQKYYAESSVFVLASIADGFGVTVSQAMACGLPVIVTENVGASDIVKDGVNGFVIPIRDVEALKEKLTFLYRNPSVRLEMGRAALKTVRAGYTWDDYGDRLAQILADRR